jgi:hypothetical protein
MSHIRSFGRFWWNFIVGDDWRVAVIIAVAIAAAAALTHSGVNAWWLVPVGVAVALSESLWRAARSRS